MGLVLENAHSDIMAFRPKPIYIGEYLVTVWLVGPTEVVSCSAQVGGHN